MSSTTVESPVRVWRIEHPADGRGPYQRARNAPLSDETLRFISALGPAHFGQPHPDPFEDGIPGLSPMEVCGFASPDLLLEWFDGYIEALDAHGFMVCVYQVPAAVVRCGNRQLVFLRDTSDWASVNGKRQMFHPVATMRPTELTDTRASTEAGEHSARGEQ